MLNYVYACTPMYLFTNHESYKLFTDVLEAAREECAEHHHAEAELHAILPEAAERCECDLCEAIKALDRMDVQP